MWGADAVAIALAVAAAAVGVSLMAYLIVSSRRPSDLDSTGQPSPTLDILLGDVGAKARWRFESHSVGTVTIDVFSHRVIGTDRPEAWRHDLMTEALVLPAGTTAELPAQTGGTRYEAAVAWYTGDIAEIDRHSRFITFERGL